MLLASGPGLGCEQLVAILVIIQEIVWLTVHDAVSHRYLRLFFFFWNFIYFSLSLFWLLRDKRGWFKWDGRVWKLRGSLVVRVSVSLEWVKCSFWVDLMIATLSFTRFRTAETFAYSFSGSFMVLFCEMTGGLRVDVGLRLGWGVFCRSGDVVAW